MAEETETLKGLKSEFDRISRTYDYDRAKKVFFIKEGSESAKDMDIFVYNLAKFVEIMDGVIASSQNPDEVISEFIDSARYADFCFHYFIKLASNKRDPALFEHCYNNILEAGKYANEILGRLQGKNLAKSRSVISNESEKDPGLIQLIQSLMGYCTRTAKMITGRAERERETETEEAERGAEADEEQQLEEGAFEYVAYVFYDAGMKKNVEGKEPKQKDVEQGRCRKISQGKARRGEEFYFPLSDKTGLSVHDFFSPTGKWKGTPVEFIGLGIKIPKATNMWGTQKYIWDYWDAGRLPDELAILIKRAAFRLKLVENIDQFSKALENVRIIAEAWGASTDARVDALNSILKNFITRKSVEEIYNFHINLYKIMSGDPEAINELKARGYSYDEFMRAVLWLKNKEEGLDKYVRKKLEEIKERFNQKFIIEEGTSQINKEAFEKIESQCMAEFREMMGNLDILYVESKKLLDVYHEHEGSM